jgi:hypothetical protein
MSRLFPSERLNAQRRLFRLEHRESWNMTDSEEQWLFRLQGMIGQRVADQLGRRL